MILMAVNGRIAGISGIASGAILGDKSVWRWCFLAGLIAGGAIFYWLTPFWFESRSGFPPTLTIVAGLLVGFGSSVGGGCTSGHGVCGISRLSARSILATATFMATGLLTVALFRHLVGAA